MRETWVWSLGQEDPWRRKWQPTPVICCLSEIQIWWGCQVFMGFQGGLSGKELPTNAEDRRCRLDPWVGKIPWRRAWQLTLVFLPGASYGHRSLVGYVHWFAKSWTRLKWLSRHVFIFAKFGNPELAGKSKIPWLCRITAIDSTGAWGQRIRSHGESAMDLRESLVGHCRKPKVHVGLHEVYI